MHYCHAGPTAWSALVSTNIFWKHQTLNYVIPQDVLFTQGHIIVSYLLGFYTELWIHDHVSFQSYFICVHKCPTVSIYKTVWVQAKLKGLKKSNSISNRNMFDWCVSLYGADYSNFPTELLIVLRSQPLFNHHWVNAFLISLTQSADWINYQTPALFLSVYLLCHLRISSTKQQGQDQWIAVAKCKNK